MKRKRSEKYDLNHKLDFFCKEQKQFPGVERVYSAVSPNNSLSSPITERIYRTVEAARGQKGFVIQKKKASQK